MILSEVTLPLAYDDCKGMALVYPYEVAVVWYTLQQQHGDPRHIGIGLPLTDGRWVMTGGVLSELHEGGIMGWACEYLTPEITAQIEVLPMIEVVPLLQETEPTDVP